MKNAEISMRYTFMGALISLLPLMIILQVVRIQVSPKQGEKLIQESKSYLWEKRTITPARGQLYDRWGNLLAGNTTVYEVGIELQYVDNAQTIAQTLSAILDLDYADIFTVASMNHSETAVYRVVADNVSQEQIDKLAVVIKQMDSAYAGSSDEDAPSLDGLVYQAHLGRIYPEKTLASNVLGFVSREGREGKGYFGIEEKYNNLLTGTPRTVYVPLDPNRAQEFPEVPNGASLILTLDRSIQQAMERTIDEALEETGAKSGTMVVLDPKSGEVLAMATTSRLDLNEYWKYDRVFPKGIPFNRAVSQAYETGSVYKVLTMATGFDTKAVSLETVFIDTGLIEIGGTTIHNWNMGAWGPQDMQGCMQHSLNVCLAWVAEQIGTNDFYQYMQAFGIGRLTGIDLAGESSGRLKVPGDGDWYAADLGTNAFGQGVAATPLQMAAAISAIANGGKIMAPHVVRSVVNEGYQQDIEQRVIGMPIQAETANTINAMLTRSLETESSVALVTGYRVAGKTGTAEIPTPFGYTTNETNASFVGWGPIDDPQFLVYVWLERPASSPWGSVVAAPVFRQAVEKLVVLMDIPPDDVRHTLKEE